MGFILSRIHVNIIALDDSKTILFGAVTERPKVAPC